MPRYQSVEEQSNSYNMLKDARIGPSFGTLHRGRVMENNDPSGTGRIKVWIPALYPSLDPVSNPSDIEILPWALPSFSTASYNAGSFTIPQIGDFVWILFETNDIFRPVYIGCMYTTGSSEAQPVGSGVAPAYQNYVPTEGLSPTHFIVTKTPRGSGLWMSDDDDTAHFVSAGGGSVELESDRASLGYSTGGTVTSMDGRIAMISPSEGYVDIDDNMKSIYITRSGENRITLTDDDGITIQYKDHKIRLSEDNLVISRNSDEQMVSLTDKYTKVESRGGHMTIYNNGELEIKAKSRVKIVAPVVEIVES